MKKNLIRLTTIGAVAALAIVATGAFFSDTETSTGNTFVAGAIDLKVDNTSYVTSTVSGELVKSPNTSWQLDDLDGHLFFDFHDLKPGDIGEDTISLHVDNNDAWMCAAARITDDSDVSYTEPELDDDNTIGDPLTTDGELAEQLNFAFWADDGDNVYEQGEQIFLEGPISGIGAAGQIALVDSRTNIWGQENKPFPGGETKHIGKAWCFGTLTPNPATPGEGGPLSGAQARGTGFTCNGEPVDNAAQTDRVMGDLQFYAVQSRNNKNFTCAADYQPKWPLAEERPLVGAALATYDDPATCTFTVTGAELIQSDINSAANGDTICVDPSYTGGDTFPINVDKEVTIAGLGAMGDANIPGGMFISASNVTIKGLEFTDYDLIQASENAAIYIHNEVGVSGVALANTTIDHNIFTAPAGAKADLAKGIVTEIGSAVAVQATGIDVLHNVFNGWRQAMFFNTTDEYEVAFNDILNNDVGVANDGPHNGSIHNNDFESNVLEAVGVAPSAANGTGNNGLLTVNTNNFFPAGAGNNVNWYGTSVQGGFDVDATNNWWDSEVEASRSNDITEVDTEPAEVSAFPEN
ncbi:TPA: hypothetical protein DIV55_04415 [Patescibacteria group bacterium]|nr:hypothetical protein [Patescibacteria group bacterium]